MIVSVQIKNKDGNYSERSYSYYCDIPVEVGTLVKAPTTHGSSAAKVVEVDISAKDIDISILPKLKRITEFADDNVKKHEQCSIDEMELSPAPCPDSSPAESVDELIVVRQLPVIEEQLHAAKADLPFLRVLCLEKA